MKEEKDNIIDIEEDDEQQSLYDVEPGEILTLCDDQGVEADFMVQGILDTEDGAWYIYLVAADEAESENPDLLIYRLADEGDDIIAIETEEEYQKAFDEFIKEIEKNGEDAE